MKKLIKELAKYYQERNREIYALSLKGKNSSAIGKKYGMTRQRVDQIVEREAKTAQNIKPFIA